MQDWFEQETERSTVSDDAVTGKLQEGEPIDGLVVHTAGFTGSGFRIFEVWASQAHFDRFREERLMPLLIEQDGADPTPPTVTVYELHGLLLP